MNGISHEIALHITIDTRGKYVPMVLINNEFGLNMCKVASCLGLELEDFTPIEQTMKAYDNSKKKAISIISMDVTISPTQFIVEF